jgi:hypothetical protein
VLPGCTDSFVAGRYHSLYGIRTGGKWPSCLVRFPACTNDNRSQQRLSDVTRSLPLCLLQYIAQSH